MTPETAFILGFALATVVVSFAAIMLSQASIARAEKDSYVRGYHAGRCRVRRAEFQAQGRDL